MTLSLARRAAHFPDRTAIIDISEERRYAPAGTIDENCISYGELSMLVAKTAERLAARGIGPGDTVCLVTRNRVASLALFFACRHLGATFAPISHLLTPASVKRPFDALVPTLVVAEPAQRDLVRSIPYDRVVTLEELAETVADPLDLDDDSPKADPVLALHGQSGRPVAGFSAGAVERNCITAVVAWGLAANDVVPLPTPLAAATGLVRVALSVLYVGATLVIDRAFDPTDAVAAMAAENATFLVGHEQAIRAIAAESGFEKAAGSLERVVCEGPVATDVAGDYRVHGVEFARAYGRLECPTALSQGFGADRAESAADGSGVGRPVPDCRVRLVDTDGTVLSGAATGRLQLSGPVVADGYLPSSSPLDERDEPDESGRGGADRTADIGRFTNGWFDTGERFNRDENGTYHPQ